MNKQIVIEGLIYFLLLTTIGCSRSSKIDYKDGAIPPEDAVKTYHVAEGFQVQLFASEPLIQNPTDMAVDENGNMYVTEMIGYPLEMNHTGKIRLLHDTDGDGVMDKATTFADNLMFPNGVMPWRGGILVTDAPYVVYFKDTTGNGQADIRDTVLAGFALSNLHVNVNNPIYGIDNWIYLANFGALMPHIYTKQFGDLGRDISFWGKPNGPHLPKDANSKNVRFKLGEGKLEMLSSRSQFGFTFNEWGELFNTNNQNHIYEEAIAARYVIRNPKLLISNTIDNISDHGEQSVVYQIRKDSSDHIIKRPQTTTSSSGITYYSGGLFPPPYDRNVTFVTESAFNLVHADKLMQNGAVYKASRFPEKQAFLASTDPWARPANIYIGPDGAVYVLDFYQKIIEHPEWLSKEIREHGPLYAGQNMGRIYRITPKGTPNASWTTALSLGNASGKELVQHLGSANSWWRTTAQRLLVTRNDQSVVSLLKEKAIKDTSAMARLHSLWTLDGLHALSVEIIEKALQDKVPGIRLNAIRLVEKYINRWGVLKLDLYGMVDDHNAKVRYQLLNTLGYLNNNEAREIRKQLLFRDISNKWVRLAALTALGIEPNRLLREVITQYKEKNEAGFLFMGQQLAEYLGVNKEQQDIAALIHLATSARETTNRKMRVAILQGLATGIRMNKNENLISEVGENQLIKTFFNDSSDSIRIYSLQLLQMKKNIKEDKEIQTWAKKALKNAEDHTLSVSDRVRMLSFLTLANITPFSARIKSIIINTNEYETQKEAIDILAQIEGTAPSNFLIENWKSIKPPVVDEAIKTFLSEESRASILLRALKDGRIPIKDLGVANRSLLMQNDNKEVREEAKELLAGNTSEGVPQNFKKAFSGLSGRGIREVGNLGKGSNIFEQNCSICHQIRGELGTAYGPDLGTVRGWSNQDLVAAILNPNASIAPGFNLFNITLKNGEKITGIIKSKSANAIELQTGPQSKRTISRQDVKEIKDVEGISPMPQGFGKQLTPQDAIDLIAYIRQSLD